MASNTTTVDPLANFPHIPVDNTLGAWLLGVAVSLLLNGTLLHQMYNYFYAYSDDRRFLKIWVVVVVVLETFISSLIIHTIYYYLVTKYWTPPYFFIAPTVWSINLLPIPGTIAAWISQAFFVRRVWMISPKFRIVVAVALMLITTNVGAFSALSYKMFNANNLTDWLKFSWLATMGSCVQMAGDLLLTFTLIYVLRTSRTGITRTDSMLDVLIMYAVSTGAINCVVHILNVAFSIAYPDNFIYAALSCILTKLYANTFLVALNTRKTLGILGGTHPSTPYHASGGGQRPRGNNRVNMPMNSVGTQPTAIELKVVTEVITEDDELEHRQTKHGRPHGGSMA